MNFDLANVFYVVIIAIVQGIAEFLPISSSGHILVLGKFFKLPDVFTLNILLHAGTLLSVLVYFFKDIVDVLLHRPRVIWIVIVGSIPTAAIGFAVMHFIPQIEESFLACGFFFLVTGLLLATMMRRYGQRTEHEIYFEEVARNAGDEDLDIPEPKTSETTTAFDAFLVGIMQGLAVFPGLSRSGSTISMALARRFSREWAAEFSFLLSIPAILGGVLLETLNIVKESGGKGVLETLTKDPDLMLYLGGGFVSFVVGLISLFYLMRMLKAGKLHYFAYWLFFIGAACLAWYGVEHREGISALLHSEDMIHTLMQKIGMGAN